MISHWMGGRGREGGGGGGIAFACITFQLGMKIFTTEFNCSVQLKQTSRSQLFYF